MYISVGWIQSPSGHHDKCFTSRRSWTHNTLHWKQNTCSMWISFLQIYFFYFTSSVKCYLILSLHWYSLCTLRITLICFRFLTAHMSPFPRNMVFVYCYLVLYTFIFYVIVGSVFLYNFFSFQTMKFKHTLSSITTVWLVSIMNSHQSRILYVSRSILVMYDAYM